MKRDMDLARRLRGERNLDHNDYLPKNGKETFYHLPNFNTKQEMNKLREIIHK